MPKWGNACKETVHWTENVHYGNRVDIVKREEQRTVQTLGSMPEARMHVGMCLFILSLHAYVSCVCVGGKIIHGDWSTLREWTESC